MDRITIDINPEKLFFTSDQHFNHKNIISFCNRPYSSIQEMNNSLIENWNKVVPKDAVIFIIGDLIFSMNKFSIRNLCNKLNGDTFYFIFGNHDKSKFFVNLPNNFKILSDIVYLAITVNNTYYGQYVLSHYPLYTFQGIDRNVINLHGHIHSGKNSHAGFDTKFKSNFHYDIGVDNNNYAPVSLKTINDIINSRKL